MTHEALMLDNNRGVGQRIRELNTQLGAGDFSMVDSIKAELGIHNILASLGDHFAAKLDSRPAARDRAVNRLITVGVDIDMAARDYSDVVSNLDQIFAEAKVKPDDLVNGQKWRYNPRIPSLVLPDRNLTGEQIDQTYLSHWATIYQEAKRRLEPTDPYDPQEFKNKFGILPSDELQRLFKGWNNHPDDPRLSSQLPITISRFYKEITEIREVQKGLRRLNPSMQFQEAIVRGRDKCTSIRSPEQSEEGLNGVIGKDLARVIEAASTRLTQKGQLNPPYLRIGDIYMETANGFTVDDYSDKSENKDLTQIGKRFLSDLGNSILQAEIDGKISADEARIRPGMISF